MEHPAAVIEALLAQAVQHTTEIEGCSLAWKCWSAQQAGATPLLLLHGGFGAWTHWVANIQALREHYQVWTVDLPGLGSSGDMPEPISVAHIARLVWAGWGELKSHDLPFDLAGFSFGAMVAGELAVTAGSSCRRCCLIGAVGFGHLQVQADLLPPPAADVEPAEAAAIHAENLGRLMLHQSSRIDPLAIKIHGDNLSRFRLRSRGMAGSNELADNLPRIAAKLVGIWGEYDVTAGGASNIEARRQLFLAAQPDMEFHVLPDVGHWAMYESPESVNRLICG